jgi:hypothetical protein
MKAQRPSSAALARAARPRDPATKAPAASAPARVPSSNSEQAAMLPARAPQSAKAGGITLPGTTRALLASRSLDVKKLATHVGAKGMPAPIAAMLLEGVKREGVSDARTLEAVLDEYIDGGEVEVYSVSNGTSVDTWLRFWCGDTEVGYIFSGGALKAIVGDQDIHPV